MKRWQPPSRNCAKPSTGAAFALVCGRAAALRPTVDAGPALPTCSARLPVRRVRPLRARALLARGALEPVEEALRVARDCDRRQIDLAHEAFSRRMARERDQRAPVLVNVEQPDRLRVQPEL